MVTWTSYQPRRSGKCLKLSTKQISQKGKIKKKKLTSWSDKVVESSCRKCDYRLRLNWTEASVISLIVLKLILICESWSWLVIISLFTVMVGAVLQLAFCLILGVLVLWYKSLWSCKFRVHTLRKLAVM